MVSRHVYHWNVWKHPLGPLNARNADIDIASENKTSASVSGGVKSPNSMCRSLRMWSCIFDIR